MLKHGLQEWQTDPDRAGLRARHLTLSMAEDLLTRGCDVIVGQYLARADFIEELQGLADAAGSVFAEFVLLCDEQTLRARLEQRARAPERPEHEVNSRLATADDVPGFLTRMERLRQRRPSARPIDASGSLEATVGHLLTALPT